MLIKKTAYIPLISILIFTLSLQVNPQSFLITKYSTDTGLPDNRVNDIVQDSLGRIWIATASGIAMYDGYEWTKFGKKDGVPEVEYIKIKIDTKNKIWFLPKQLYDQSLVFYHLNRWSQLTLKSAVNNTQSYTNAFEVVYENERLQIYISKINKGLLYFSNGVWEKIGNKQGLICDTISNITSNANKIFVCTYKGVSELARQKIINNLYQHEKKFGLQIMGMTNFILQNNKKWTTYTLGSNWIGVIQNKKIVVIKSDIRIPSLGFNDPHFIISDNDNHLYFGNSSFLYSYDVKSNLVKRIVLESPQSDRGGSSVFVDAEKNVWVSSLRGIYKLTLSPFDNLVRSKGLSEIEVSAIAQFNSGELVFGHNYGISILDHNQLKYIEIASPEVTKTVISRITSIFHDLKSDVMYLTSVQGGIFLLNKNGIVKNFSFPNISRYTFTTSYIQGGAVVFTNRGYYGIGNNVKVVIPNSILIRTAIIYNDYEYLIGTTSGFYNWKINTKNIAPISNSSSLNIFSIFNFHDSCVFAGTMNGLYKFQNDSLQKFNFNDYDITDPIYFIIQDSSKNIWLGTNNGVLKWDGKYLKRYNKSDGLAGNETNRAAGFVDSKGNVWIGTDEGVSMYTGNEPDYSKYPPKAMLMNFTDHTNQIYDITKNNKVEPNNNNLIFNYRGLSFIDEKRNVYQIKLTEVDGDYQNEFYSKSTSARFNNLAAGNYIFSVRVKNSKGIWSAWKNSAIISVEEHFYNEPIFYLSIFAAFIIAAFTINDYYQQRKYNKRLEKAVEVRTKDLKKTQEQLITSVNRYKGIVESQTDLLIRFDESAILTFVNDAYCAMFGKKPEELIGKSFIPLVHPDDVEPTFEAMKKLKYPPYRSTIEQRDLTVDGFRWFAWEGYAVHDNLGNVLEIQAVGRDITIQKEVEAELEKRVNERTIELQSLISQSPLGIMTFNSEGYLLTFNKIANEMFGSLKQFLFPSKDFNILSDHFLKKNNYLAQLKEFENPNSFILTTPIAIDEAQNKIYSNLYNHILVYRIYNVVFDDQNQMYVLLLDDVTERQKSAEVTKKLLEEKVRISTIIQTIESERDRFARELHDGLGQLLTTAKLKLDIIKLKTDLNIKEIDETVNVLINAGDEIRRIINDLKPSDVERFGLISSVELLIERVKQATGINIYLSVINAIKLNDKNLEIIIYRIVQEALNNIVKHSKCNNATIELLMLKNEIQIAIVDDGVGYDLNSHSQKIKSFGINNIKERVNSINGLLKIETEPGKGFKYFINIPI